MAVIIEEVSDDDKDLRDSQPTTARACTSTGDGAVSGKDTSTRDGGCSKHKAKEEEEDDAALHLKNLRALLRKQGGYSSSLELNDVLRLHHLSITRFSAVTALRFPNLTTLYLNNNAIQGLGDASDTPSLSGLAHLPSLLHLYLADNCIADITGCIPISAPDAPDERCLTTLETLDLSNNGLRTTRGFAVPSHNDTDTYVPRFPKLKTLLLSRNALASVEDCAGLAHIPTLESLDVSENRSLGSKDEAEKYIELLPASSLLYLRFTGCGITSALSYYRKRVLLALPTLRYLDEQPCFDKERRLASAWAEGGMEAERGVRATIRSEEAALRKKHADAFDAMIQRARDAADAAPPHDKSIFVATDGGGEGEDDDDGFIVVKSPREEEVEEEEEEEVHQQKKEEEEDFEVEKSTVRDAENEDYMATVETDEDENAHMENAAPEAEADVLGGEDEHDTHSHRHEIEGDDTNEQTESQKKTADTDVKMSSEDRLSSFEKDEDARIRMEVFKTAASVAADFERRGGRRRHGAQSNKITNNTSSTSSMAEMRQRSLVRHRNASESLRDASRPLIFGGGGGPETGSPSPGGTYQRLWDLARSIPDTNGDGSEERESDVGHNAGAVIDSLFSEEEKQEIVSATRLLVVEDADDDEDADEDDDNDEEEEEEEHNDDAQLADPYARNFTIESVAPPQRSNGHFNTAQIEPHQSSESLSNPSDLFDID